MIFIWYPILILVSVLSGYLSYKANQVPDNKWIVGLWAINVIPLWAIIAKISKHLVFEGLVYDITSTVIYTSSVVYFMDKSIHFNNYQIGAIIVMVCALVVFKVYS